MEQNMFLISLKLSLYSQSLRGSGAFTQNSKFVIKMYKLNSTHSQHQHVTHPRPQLSPNGPKKRQTYWTRWNKTQIPTPPEIVAAHVISWRRGGHVQSNGWHKTRALVSVSPSAVPINRKFLQLGYLSFYSFTIFYLHPFLSLSLSSSYFANFFYQTKSHYKDW
jgi:hypothetical protein